MTNEAPFPDLLTAALNYAARGWAIVPVIGATPAVRELPVYPPGEHELRRWFGTGSQATALAVVLGMNVSPRMAAIRFANPDRFGLWTRTLRYHGIAEPPVIIAPNGQAVALFTTRVEPALPPQGGFVILPPTAGYRWWRGTPSVACGVPLIEPLRVGLNPAAIYSVGA